MRLAVVFAVLLAAGCAGVYWHKPETDAATLARELDECRQNARAQAQRETLPRAFASPLPMAADPRGQPVVSQLSSRDADILLLEQDLTRACMEGKGYKLAQKNR